MSEQRPQPAPKPRWSQRLDERRERHAQRGRLYRVVFAIAGAIVTLGGIAMLVLPGPALVVIPIGLAMLAMEFTWAENMLERALHEAEKAQRTAKQATPAQRLFSALAAAAVVAAIVAWAIIGDIPVVPDP